MYVCLYLLGLVRHLRSGQACSPEASGSNHAGVIAAARSMPSYLLTSCDRLVVVTTMNLSRWIVCVQPFIFGCVRFEERDRGSSVF